MATYNRTALAGVGSGSRSFRGSNAAFLVSEKCAVGTASSPVSSTDVLNVLNVKAGWLVLWAGIKILQAAGGTCTGIFGDGDDDNGWDASSVNLNATAGTVTLVTKALTEGTPNVFTDALFGGKHYTADDTLDITLDAGSALVAGYVAAFAFVVDLNDLATL